MKHRFPAPAAAMMLALIGTFASAARPGRVIVPDTRLDQKVQIDQPFGTLSGYLKALSTKSGVSHLAKPPFGERDLVALEISLSLRELQKALSRDLILSWERKEQQYRLLESPRDRMMRRNAWERSQARAIAAMMARFQHKASLTELSNEDLEGRAGAGDPFARLLVTDRKRHRGMSSMTLRLIMGLPGSILEQVCAGRVVDVRFSQLPREGQLLFRQIPTLRRILPAVDQNEIPQHGAIRISLGGTWSRPELQAQLRFDRARGNVASLSSTSVNPDPSTRRLGLHWSKQPAHPEFKKKVTLTDTGRPAKGYFSGGERPPGALPLQPYLLQLAGQIDLPLVAECAFKPKDPAWLAKQWWMLEEITDQPLSRALDLLCADFEFEWELRDGVLLLRPVPGAVAGGKNFRPNVPSFPDPVPAEALHPQPPVR